MLKEQSVISRISPFVIIIPEFVSIDLSFVIIIVFLSRIEMQLPDMLVEPFCDAVSWSGEMKTTATS